MTELSDVVIAQNKTTIVLRAFLKIFLVYFVASLVIGIATIGYLYFTVRNLSGCALSELTGSCSRSNMPLICEVIIAIFAIGGIVLTFITANKALNESVLEAEPEPIE